MNSWACKRGGVGDGGGESADILDCSHETGYDDDDYEASERGTKVGRRIMHEVCPPLFQRGPNLWGAGEPEF